MTPIWHPSPNFGPRRDRLLPSLVVLHYTAMQTAQAALERLCDPAAQVSAHYLIGADGTIWQMVDEAQRAWHAGAGTWQGNDDVNSRSIGIELDNRGDHGFSNLQICALETLLPKILTRWSIPPKGVIGHSDMAVDRKQDPGRRFDWLRLARQGLAVWPTDATPVDDFRQAAMRFGYSDDNPDLVLDAMRQRFRPQAVGALQDRDRAIIGDLARRFGVDADAASA